MHWFSRVVNSPSVAGRLQLQRYLCKVLASHTTHCPENGGVHERQAPCRVEVSKLRCDREEMTCLDRALGVGRIVFRSGENRVRLSIHKIPTKAVP